MGVYRIYERVTFEDSDFIMFLCDCECIHELYDTLRQVKKTEETAYSSFFCIEHASKNIEHYKILDLTDFLPIDVYLVGLEKMFGFDREQAQVYALDVNNEFELSLKTGSALNYAIPLRQEYTKLKTKQE